MVEGAHVVAFIVAPLVVLSPFLFVDRGVVLLVKLALQVLAPQKLPLDHFPLHVEVFIG